MIRNYHIDTNTRRWLNRFKPDAIVGFPFVWIYSLRAAGFRIPEEMGFASPISSFYFHGEAEVDGGDPMVEILEYRMVELLHTLLLTGMRGMSPTAEIGSLQDVVLPKWIECGTLPTLHWQNKTVQSTVDASPARYDQRTHKEKEGHPLWLAW